MKSEIGKKGLARLRKKAVKSLIKERLLGLERIENCIICSGDRTVALSLKLEYQGKVYRANGAARCNMVDSWSEEIGVEIARGRALFRLGSQVLATTERAIECELEAFKDFIFGEVDRWVLENGRDNITEQEFVSIAKEALTKNNIEAPSLNKIFGEPGE